VKFNLVREESVIVNYTELLLYHFLIVIVAYAGVKFSAPVLMEFCNLKAMKMTILMSVAACIVFVVMTVIPRCDHGEVAGLSETVYEHPECSLSCNCHPRWNEFQPVCVMDKMVTYVSPCQAGCRSTETINGFFVYSNCTCSAGGHAQLGACSNVRCTQSFHLHGMLLYTVITFTVLVFQAQGVLLLRIVDQRDKSVVMGLAWSMVAFICFVCGHLIFIGIGLATCNWYEVEKCHLQNHLYPTFIGGTSALLALLSIIISIGSYICLRVSNKMSSDREQLARGNDGANGTDESCRDPFINENVKNRVLSWFNPKKFDPRKLRGVLMGVTIITTVGEICTYKLLVQDIKSGEIPFYTPDLMIVALSIFEALVAPFVSWWGYGQRRTMLLAYSSLVTVCSISWFFIPNVEERSVSELCGAAEQINIKFEGTTTRSITRLSILTCTGVSFILARTGCWSHGIAYSDEYAPSRTSVHYGVVLLSRVVVLIIGERIMTSLLETNLSIQTLILVLSLAVNVIQLLFIVPKVVPEVDGVQRTALSDEDRGFFLSLGRVMCNSVAITQMLAMGLMAAALWGYVYNESEIVKVKFNWVREDNGIVNYTELLLYHFLVVIVAYAGVKFSAPILMEFCNLKAMKQTILMSMAACIVFVVMTFMPRCDHGEVAGLSETVFGHPECSLPCNCLPRWNEFQPVCVMDEMVTYLSPCQAGCRSTETINGFFVYSNCTCTAGGRAQLGACSNVHCHDSYHLHGMLLFIITTFTVLVFQAQGVLLLRIVDQRDKSVVMGLAWSMVAFICFVCGHLIFIGIGVATCNWYEVEKCHLQSHLYPSFIGGTSALLAFLSIIISIGSYICLRVSNKVKLDQNTRL
ncbi:unnamed protein product, partial [Brenthis ino]